MIAIVLAVAAVLLVAVGLAIMVALTVTQQRHITYLTAVVRNHSARIDELEKDRDNHRRRIEVLEDHPDFRLLRAMAAEALDRSRGLEVRIAAVEGERDEMRAARDEAYAAVDSLKRQLRRSDANGSGHQDESA